MKTAFMYYSIIKYQGYISYNWLSEILMLEYVVVIIASPQLFILIEYKITFPAYFMFATKYSILRMKRKEWEKNKILAL